MAAQILMFPIFDELKKILNSNLESKKNLFSKYTCTYKEIDLVMIVYASSFTNPFVYYN